VPNSTSSSTLGASGSRQNPLTLELLEEEMYTVEWTEGEFGYALERVYLEDGRKFFRCVFNTRRATCPSFDKVKKGDLLVQVGDEMISDMELETNQKLTKFFRDVKLKLPIALKFQRVQEVDL
jgi:hypothetical protein